MHRPHGAGASMSTEKPDSKDSDRINRMDWMKPFANPVNPVHPVQPGSSFSAAPDFNTTEFIKSIDLFLHPAGRMLAE